MQAYEPAPSEITVLRRCIRELTALSSLSAAWTRSEVREIAEGLCVVLVRALPATLAYVQLTGPTEAGAIEVASTQSGLVSADRMQAVIEALHPALETGAAMPRPTVRDPFGTGELRLALIPLGFQGDWGVLVVASRSADFPSQMDRLLMNVAANQAVIVLQQKSSEEQTLRNERELSDFFDNAAVGLHWVGPDGTILRANRAELDMLGYSAEEYIGHHIAEFHADQDAICEILRRLQAGDELRECEAKLRCRDGSIRHVVISSNVLRRDGMFVHTRCFTRDVTARKHAEERLRLLWEAAELLLAASNPDAVLPELFAKIAPPLGLDVYFNYLMDDTATLRLASYMGVTDATAQSVARLELGQAFCGAVALRQEPVYATHIQQSDDPATQLARSLGLQTFAGYPLLAAGRLLGTLSFGSRTRNRLETEELAFLETICHYVTQAYERLRLLGQLTEADRRKDDFLATLAHELRNPLAPIRNAVQLLRFKGTDEPEIRWARDVVERQVSHLTRLIDDLLDISRITRNNLELRKERVALADVIRGAIETSRPLIEQRNHELSIQLPAEPIYLHADLVRLAQVFMNLLTNAAKYTDRGGRIGLYVERQATEVLIRVQDNGVGIPPQDLPRLFDMFFQVDRSWERSQGGLGIGLSLVRRLVQLHGGGVEVRSAGVGKGSEFTVRLPLPADQPDAPPAQDVSNDLQPTCRRRVLVVDDNRDAADSLAMLLRLMGHDVRTAYDGIEAVEAADQFRPDIALLDIGMPKLNGYEACRQMKQQAADKRIVLIAMTGWGQDQDRRRTNEAGFDAHLVKPVDIAALSALIA